MATRPDYADQLRDSLLALAVVPLAGFDTATYWLKETFERTSRFGADVVASAALARFTQPRDAAAERGPDPVADVLARDLLDSARTYVRSMVRLPADSGVYFTGEIERRLNALLEQIQPEAEKDLEAYADAELQRLLQELDRLFVVVRAEARRAGSATADEALKSRQNALLNRIDDLRTGIKNARAKLAGERREVPSLTVPGEEDRLRALKVQKARIRLLQALRDAQILLPGDQAALEGIERLIEYLEAKAALQSLHLPKEAG